MARDTVDTPTPACRATSVIVTIRLGLRDSVCMEPSFARKSARGKVATGNAFIHYGSASIDFGTRAALSWEGARARLAPDPPKPNTQNNIDVITMIPRKIRETLRCTNPILTALPCA